MTRHRIGFAALAVLLLMPAVATAANKVCVDPDQVRSFGTDSKAESASCFTEAPPAGCPNTAPPGQCPLGFGGLAGGLIDSIIEIFNPTPFGVPPGACNNAAGDGLLGYANFGPLTGTLICNPGPPPITVDFESVEPDRGKDITSVFRFPIPPLPPAPPTSIGSAAIPNSWVGAVLEITPALPAFVGIAPTFWPTISVSLCDIPIKGVWTNVPGFDTVLDSEGQVVHPLNPNPVDPDCIVTNRDGLPAGGGLGQFDVVLNVASENPEAGHVGGVDNLSFFLGLLNFGPSQTIKIPLNHRALKVLNSGGTPEGYLELTVRMADQRGHHSEGPNATRVPLGFPNGVNMMVIHDENGCTYNNPVAGARTKLTLIADQDARVGCAFQFGECCSRDEAGNCHMSCEQDCCNATSECWPVIH